MKSSPRAVQRRRTDFEALYERHSREVWALAYARWLNADLALDIMQEAFMRLWKQWQAGEEILNPRAWLLRVARNLAEDHAKSAFRRNGTHPPQTMNGVDIKNNIIYQNGHNGVDFYAATGSGVVLDHNLCYGNAYGTYNFTDGGSTCSYTQGTSISSDPRCVNDTSSGFDAHLGSGSPAILAGLNLSSALTTDITGAARSATLAPIAAIRASDDDAHR